MCYSSLFIYMKGRYMEAERKVYGKQAFFVAEKMYNHNNNYYYECKIGLRKRKKIIIIQM